MVCVCLLLTCALHMPCYISIFLLTHVCMFVVVIVWWCVCGCVVYPSIPTQCIFQENDESHAELPLLLNTNDYICLCAGVWHNCLVWKALHEHDHQRNDWVPQEEIFHNGNARFVGWNIYVMDLRLRLFVYVRECDGSSSACAGCSEECSLVALFKHFYSILSFLLRFFYHTSF